MPSIGRIGQVAKKKRKESAMPYINRIGQPTKKK